MDSIEHPLRNWKQFLILSVLFVVVHFLCTTSILGSYSLILFIIGFVIEIILFGYLFSVALETMRSTDKIPQINFVENIVDGIKYFVLAFIFSIIPLAVLFLLFSTSGNTNPLWMIMNLITPNTMILGLVTGEFVETLLYAIISAKYVTTYTIIFLLGFIFSYPFFMSLTRIIATGKFTEGFKFKKIFKIYKEIGFPTYTKWFVMIYIYLIVFTGLWALLSLIPGGDYVAYFIIAPFILLFIGRSIGLLYKQGIKYTESNKPKESKKIDKTNILQEEALRKKALEQSAKRYSEEIERVNQLRKKNYTKAKAQLPKKEEKEEPKKEDIISKTEKFTSANKEKLENLKPVTEIKPIKVKEDKSVEEVKKMINDDSINTDEIMDKLQKALEEKAKDNKEE